MRRTSRPVLAALAAVALAAGSLTLTAAGASAASRPATTVRPAAAALPAAAAARGPVADVVPTSACGTARPGFARCLAKVRSLAGAVRAGVPTGADALAATRSGRLTAGSFGVAAAAVAPPTSGYGPKDLKAMYALDTTLGAGTTVAVVDAFDNPNAEKDLAAFRSAYGLPPCTKANGCFRKVNQRGNSTPPAADSGWGIEIALDIQAVSAVCPKCRILLVEADSNSNTDLGAAVNRAVTLGAKIVSNSWAGPEVNGSLAEGAKYYTHPGVALLFSSGDFGFTDAAFPASWSRSIAVGGTKVVKTSTGYKHTAWSGAGSGCSAWVKKPAWQKDTHCLLRTISDVSALADPDTGFAVYDTFQVQDLGFTPGWFVVGGTSLSAPLVAGMVALAGNPAALSDASYLYAHRSGLRDVTRGSNGFCGGDYLCTAKVGYDGPTGLGTPNGLSAL